MNNGQKQQQHPAAQQQQTALATIPPVDTSPTAIALVPTSIDGAYQLAAWLSNAQLLPPALRGKQADLFTMILAGMELGLPPMAALRGMYIVNGKPALESKTKAAICLQRGAATYFKRIEYTPEATTWETLRNGQTEPVRSRYTKAEAKAAGLLDKDGPWKNYSQRMQSHRALGWLCDDVYPDIVLGVATAEDFDDVQQVSFAPVPTVAGVELGAKVVVDEPAKKVAPSVPATAKPANVEQTTASTEPQQPARQFTEEELLAIERDITACRTIAELRGFAAQRIGDLPDGGIRDRLAKAYQSQKELIQAAARDEGDPR